ncbi:MAG: hypothetical protein V8R43_02045 [Dorea sp.]
MKVMFGVGAHGIGDQESMYVLRTNMVLWLMLAIGSTRYVHVRYEHRMRSRRWNTTMMNGVVYVILFVVSIAYLVTETYNPFLYSILEVTMEELKNERIRNDVSREERLRRRRKREKKTIAKK